MNYDYILQIWIQNEGLIWYSFQDGWYDYDDDNGNKFLNCTSNVIYSFIWKFIFSPLNIIRIGWEMTKMVIRDNVSDLAKVLGLRGHFRYE